MFSRIWTKPYTKSCSEQIERLKAALQDCDAVVIGAGAGLSTSAGFVYTVERFEKYFSDFAAKYGIKDMYSGGFYPFAMPEEHWSYWSRYIYINRYMDAPKPVYDDLLKLVSDKDYFVSRPTWITVFRKQALIKSGCFTRRAITACSSAVSRAARKHTTMSKSSVRWLRGRRICAYRASLCRIVRSAADR